MKASLLRRIIQNRAFMRCCCESLLDLFFCKCLIFLAPVKYWHRSCGQFQCETLKQDVQKYRSQIMMIRRAVQLVAKYVESS